jgi:sarcosine oxidase subunit beta
MGMMSPRAREMGRADAPLPPTADVAIIGGGIMGLATAYELAMCSKLRVVVIERSYLVSGASGRNGGGVRMQWGDVGNVALMMESIEICRSLAQDLAINLWFRQGGYLFLARTEDGQRRLERNARIHQEVGAPTRLLSGPEAREIVPELDVTDVRLAAFNPRDGVVFPWPFVWGYAAQAQRRGVVVRTHTAVDDITPEGDALRLSLSSGESITADTVVNATGAWSIELNHRLGIELPNRPHRHEIMSSEPLKPFLDPLVVDLANGLYFSQSTRGEIVAGITMPHEEPPPESETPRVELNSSRRFLSHLAAALVAVMPHAGSLKVLRQWAGPYDVSPDGDAIVGRSPSMPRLIQLCGFTGHGFMMAPAVGRLVARFIAHDESHAMLSRWDPARFESGASTRREDMIIG